MTTHETTSAAIDHALQMINAARLTPAGYDVLIGALVSTLGTEAPTVVTQVLTYTRQRNQDPHGRSRYAHVSQGRATAKVT